MFQVRTFVLFVLAMGFCFSSGTPVAIPQASAAVGDVPKVYVFPYQAVFEGVPNEVLTQTTELLKTEIKNSSDVRLQKGPLYIPEAMATKIQPLSEKELQQAESFKKQGEDFYQKLRFDKAINAFRTALERYEKSIALLQDFTPVVDCLLMLSACYYRQDQEGKGAEMLIKVIRLKPDLVLDPEKYPPMFINTTEEIRKKLLLKTRGELEVVANAEAATVFLNGKQVGSTPIIMKDLVPGEHYVRVEKEGLQTWADKVVVVSTQRRGVMAALGGVKKATGLMGEIAEELRTNRITQPLLQKISQQGKEIAADFVVVGGVAKKDNGLRVGSFLIKVSNLEFCALPEIQLDPDMLGANVEVYNVASELFKRAEGCPDPIKVAAVAVVQTAQKKKEEAVKTVSVGPALPPVETTKEPEVKTTIPVKPSEVVSQPAEISKPAVSETKQPEQATSVTSLKPTTSQGPALPTNNQTPKESVAVNQIPRLVTTEEGLVTTGSSALSQTSTNPIVIPQDSVGERVRPIDEQKDGGSKWYTSWWFWTVVGVVVVGAGTTGIMYGAGVFDGGTSGASVSVTWPTQ